MISIITATYNSAATLEDTLESLQRQGISDLQVIIQDGGSTDSTLEIARRYPFTEIVSESDAGLYNAMNKGISRATGDVIGILNSDDYYPEEDVLMHVLKAFSENPELMAVYGNLKYVDQDDTSKTIRYWNAKPYRPDAWELGWMPPHPTFFVRRKVYEQYGTFNESLRFAADYEFMLRVCYKHKIRVGFIPKVLVHMRAGGVSNSSLKNRVQANKEDRLAWTLNALKPPIGLGLFKPLRKVKQWLNSKK